jgi:hypothetical protein
VKKALANCAWEKVRGVAALKGKRGGGGVWEGLGFRNARRGPGKPWSGGEEKMEKVVIQGLANPESGTCDGNLSHTSDPV